MQLMWPTQSPTGGTKRRKLRPSWHDLRGVTRLDFNLELDDLEPLIHDYEDFAEAHHA